MKKKKIAFFDIDKTIYDGYLIFPLAEYFLEENIITRDIIDSLDRGLHLYRSKQTDYESTVENFNKDFASGLKGYSSDLITGKTITFLKTMGVMNFFSFAKPLMKLLGKTHDIYFVTGEVQFVGKAVADYFSVQGYISSEIEIKDGLFTGNISKSLAKKEEKSAAIEKLFNTYPKEKSMAFGDSEGDIDMLNKVVHAFCINATEGLMEVALTKGWNIVNSFSILEEVKKILQSKLNLNN